MGANIPKCMVCGSYETENNPVFEVHSKGKRNGQSICWRCIKRKLYKKYEKKINHIYSFDRR